MNVPQKIAKQQLYQFATDIARGMEYISSHQVSYGKKKINHFANMSYNQVADWPGKKYPWEFLMKVCRLVLQILTLFRFYINAIFHTRSHTWPLGRNYVIFF